MRERLVLALKVLAVAGFWYVAYVYLTLPDLRPLVRTNPTTTAFIERRVDQAADDGKTMKPRQRWVSYSRISPNLTRAVLVTEDSAFWQHEGIDLEQIRESMEVNIERMEFARGASTITQQLAKNLYLSPSKNPARKLKELMIARRLEADLSKRRILEIYLNVIEWGDGIFGAEAAARAYFGAPASSLGAEQAALLAAAIANPRVMNPARPTRRLQRRQQMVLRRMGAARPPEDASPAPAPALPAAAPPAEVPPSPTSSPRS
jgi:monofunctional biosynthetic peptidoglycan transglycosylase